LNPLQLLAETESRPDSQPACGARICEDYMREARLIQSSLIPSQPFRDNSVEIAFRFTPFFDVGGDFVDFFRLPDGMIGLYLGDVVGKGLPASMYGALVMGMLRGIHKTDTDTATVLSLLNQRLMQRSLPGRFCSTLYAVFDPSSRSLAFSNAGLPFPLHASAVECQPIGQGGLPSGLLASATYDQHIIQLSPGDSVLFATDGLHESLNPAGIEFGSSSMLELWAQSHARSAAESLDHLFDGLLAFADGTAPHDDITAIVLKVRS
jgi:phosphoserine phosphatase RsbU/P